MATDGQFGLRLMRRGAMKQKKKFAGVFMGQLRDHTKEEGGKEGKGGKVFLHGKIQNRRT